MTTIYLIRHGESEANKKGIFLGHHNLHLTQTGQEQAAKTAEYLKSLISCPDAIYASDLWRAYETAQCTAERFQMPIIKDEQLREINAGLWEGVYFADLGKTFPESFKVWSENIGRARCDSGESVEELQQRIVSAVARIAQQHDGGTVFLFTHATPVRVLGAHCLGKALDEIKTVPWATNASVTKVIYDSGTFRLMKYGFDGFMGDLVTKLPSNV